MADTVGSPDRLLRRLYQTAVAAAQPEHYLPPALPRLSDLPHTGRLIVVGAGKAAAAMAQCAEQHWRDDPRFSQVTGLVIARHGEARPTRHIEIVEAAHPVPDKHAVAATERIVSLLHGAGPEDRVLCLLSGGGSALLCLPATGIGLAEKQNVTRALLASGAPIDAIN
ncbi:MAG TPA: glycerate kinase, partial [Alphaproteobacteria bacterium]|nr:glycerate kinase [Alphaproteobacteria bacterium]